MQKDITVEMVLKSSYTIYKQVVKFCNPIFNIFHTTANCVTVGIDSSCAYAQNSWGNLEKSETQKLA